MKKQFLSLLFLLSGISLGAMEPTEDYNDRIRNYGDISGDINAQLCNLEFTPIIRTIKNDTDLTLNLVMRNTNERAHILKNYITIAPKQTIAINEPIPFFKHLPTNKIFAPIYFFKPQNKRKLFLFLSVHDNYLEVEIDNDIKVGDEGFGEKIGRNYNTLTLPPKGSKLEIDLEIRRTAPIIKYFLTTLSSNEIDILLNNPSFNNYVLSLPADLRNELKKYFIGTYCYTKKDGIFVPKLAQSESKDKCIVM